MLYKKTIEDQMCEMQANFCERTRHVVLMFTTRVFVGVLFITILFIIVVFTTVDSAIVVPQYLGFTIDLEIVKISTEHLIIKC